MGHTYGTLTREELISIRDSLRSMILELHNSASILDQVIQRNGGPALSKTPVKASRLSDHIDHAMFETYLREIQEVPKASAKEYLFQQRVPVYVGHEDHSQSNGIVHGTSSVASWVIWAVLLLFSFTFDCTIVLLLRSFMRVVGTEPLPPVYPGRSRSPVRESKPEHSRSLLAMMTEGIREDPRSHILSLIIGLSVQYLLFIGNFVVYLFVYTCRCLGFLLLCLLLWDNMRSSTQSKFNPTSNLMSRTMTD